MDVAEELLRHLFSWLEQRKEWVDRLLILAQELENLHHGANTGRVVGSSVAVGTALLALLTLCTGGLAAPVALAVGGTIVNQALDVGLQVGENWRSSAAMTEAKEMIKKDEETGQAIRKLQQQLMAQSAGAGQGASARAHGFPDAQSYAAYQVMKSMSKILKLSVPPRVLMALSSRSLGTAGKASISFVQDVGLIGMRTLPAMAAKAVSGVLGLVISIPELVQNCERLVKDNNMTEASRALRNAAREIQEATAELQKKIDSIQESLREMVRVRDSIQRLGQYSMSMTQDGQRIIDFLMSNSDPQVASWFNNRLHNIQFTNLVRLLYGQLQTLLEQQRHKQLNGHVHIVVVGHGGIKNQTLPASCLMPLNSIRDVIFYSPWNCAIDHKVAVGIAVGTIQPRNRVLVNPRIRDQLLSVPSPLPPHWNNMRRAGNAPVPEMILSPVYVNEPAWTGFMNIGNWIGLERQGRILVPYLMPSERSDQLPEIPLSVFNLALSLLLSLFFSLEATVHWSACLNYNDVLPPNTDLWRRQYAYTVGGTFMTLDVEMSDVPQYQDMYNTFRAMFSRRQ